VVNTKTFTGVPHPWPSGEQWRDPGRWKQKSPAAILAAGDAGVHPW